MRVEEITESQYYNFMDQYTEPFHYGSDPSYYKNIKNHSEIYRLGLFDGEKLIGTCLTIATSVLKRYRSFQTMTGPYIMGFDNKKLKFFLSEIEKFIKKKKGIYIMHSPYMVYQTLDKDGEVNHDAYKNHEVIDVYQKLGYQHAGFTKELTSEGMLRYQSVLNITPSEKELLKDMDSSTRNSIYQSEKLPMEVTTVGEEDYDRFIDIYKDTEARIGFDAVSRDKLKRIIKALSDQADVTITVLNLSNYEQMLINELSSLEAEKIDYEHRINNEKVSKKFKKKYNELKSLIEGRENKLKKVQLHKAQYGEYIDVSAAMYYYNQHEMVYLFSGAPREFAVYKGTYFTSFEMIKKAKNMNIPRFNFYGITGDLNKETSKDYGVYLFKRSFNAHIEELPGTFSKVLNKPVYIIANKLGKI